MGVSYIHVVLLRSLVFMLYCGGLLYSCCIVGVFYIHVVLWGSLLVMMYCGGLLYSCCIMGVSYIHVVLWGSLIFMLHCGDPRGILNTAHFVLLHIIWHLCKLSFGTFLVYSYSISALNLSLSACPSSDQTWESQHPPALEEEPGEGGTGLAGRAGTHCHPPAGRGG